MKGNVRWKNQWQSSVRTDRGRGNDGGVALSTLREWALFNIPARVEGQSPMHISYFKDFERSDDKEGEDTWGHSRLGLSTIRVNQCTRGRDDLNIQGGTN